jgi:endonuclease G
MAKFRKNHSKNKNPFVGLSIRVFLMIAVAVVLFFIGRRGFIDAQSNSSSGSGVNVVFEDYDRAYLIPKSDRSDIEVVNHKYYSLGYVEKYEQPAWVSYGLNQSELAVPNVERHDRFLEDPEVSSKSANYYDYRGSGYSRGHMAPAGDMAFNKEAMRESFYMSNMSPQLIPFNGGIWRELEETVRDWAYKNGRLYVITGPIFGDVDKYIGQKNKVAVPKQYYKAVVDIDNPDIKGIAFIMDHEVSTRPIMDYAVTIDELEEAIGMELFDDLIEDDIEQDIEGNINIRSWPVSKKRYQQRVDHWNNN